MVGFLLSFRNRSTYYGESMESDPMTAFNGTFEFTFFQMLTFTVGQIVTDNMGIDSLAGSNLVNFLIYGCFIFIMPILFFNTFTGIAINETEKLLEKAEAENISIKIDYVFKIENILEKLSFKYIKICIEFVECGMKKFNDFATRILKKIKKIIHYKDKIDEKEFDDKEKTDEKLNNLILAIMQVDNKIKNIEDKCNKLEETKKEQIETDESRLGEQKKQPQQQRSVQEDANIKK